MKNLIKKKEGEKSFVRYIKRRINNNLNFLAIAEGPTGIGKSWAMLSIAHMIDPDFEIKQVAFSFKQVMEIINFEWFRKKKYKIIVFDESQIDISNREWQSLTNKLMNYLLSTFRHQNVILLFTSPYSDFLDSHSMKLMHCKFEVRGHDRNEKKTTIRPKLLQYNSRKSKFYEHSLYVMTPSGTEKLQYWKVDKPPQKLIDPYEKAKTEFTSKLNKDIMKQLEDKDKEIDTRRPLTDQQRDILLAMKECDTQKEVSEKLGIDGGQVSRQLKSTRKKGYTPEDVDY